MFDPLHSTASIFANGEDTTEPPWPTTPHQPNSPIPNLRRASTPLPPTPDKGPAAGLYGKEPQIYGAPEPGLISPREAVGSNGTKFERHGPYLRVRITGLDRNRRDILVRLDAQTNLSNFTGTTYRNVSRSYLEFQQFYESIAHSNPQTIVPALPLAQTSAPTDEEDDRLVKIMLQRWLTRICEDPILLHDEELRSFIESDFGYQPTPRPRRKTSSGFGLIRRGVPDEDEELQRARFELTKLETQFFDAAKAIDKLALSRKALSLAQIEMGNKLINVATTEAHPPLGNAFRKIGRTWHSLADLSQAQAISECVVVADSFGYQGMNSRSAKETLQQRTGVLEEYQAAVKTTISKRRNIERLKASSNIRPERVDDALEDMEEANKYEQILAKRAEGISQNLHRALDVHTRLANDDVNTALIEHARSTIMYERQLLRELEALRTDVNNAANKAVPKTNPIPRPSVIPPLEDFSRPPPDLRTQSAILPPKTMASSSSRGPLVSPPPPAKSFVGQGNPPALQSPTPRPSSAVQPSFASREAQSPGAGPSTPRSQSTFATPTDEEPPLGGRLVQGSLSRSSFAGSVSSPLHSPAPTSSSSFAQSPNQRAQFTSQTLGRAVTSPLTNSTPALNGNGRAAPSDDLDPLGQARPTYMSNSVRVQPTRPRLDPKEAASKLANMF